MIHLLNESLNVNNQHYYYGSVDSLLTALSSQDVTFTEDNYRLNNNILRVGITEAFTLATAIGKHTVVHVIDTYKRVYNVVRYEIQSGYILYTLEIDLWHTYIYDADVRNLRINRSTRDIVINGEHMGFYKKPLQAMKSPKFIPLDLSGGEAEDVEVNASEFSLVLAVKYNLFQSQTGSMSITKLFSYDIGDLLETYCDAVTTAGNPYATSRCIQDVISDLLSGLYEVEATITEAGGTQTTFTVKAELKNAWIIDSALLWEFGQEAGMLTNLKLKFRSKHVGWEDVALKPNWISCSDGRAIQGNGYTLPAKVRELSFDDTKPNCHYLIGTPHANMEVNALYGGIKAELRCTTDIDDLKVLLIQGDQELDITSAFSLNFTAVDGDITLERYILDAIQNALPLISSWGGLANSALTGNVFGALSGASNVFGHATSMILNSPQFAQRTGYNVKAGNAGMAFFANYSRWLASGGLLTNPYCVVEIEDEITEIDELQYNGLVYDVTVASFADLFRNFDATTGTAVVGTVDGYDYLQCSQMTFAGNVPKEAEQYIYNKLVGGIRIKEL